MNWRFNLQRCWRSDFVFYSLPFICLFQVANLFGLILVKGFQNVFCYWTPTV